MAVVYSVPGALNNAGANNLYSVIVRANGDAEPVTTCRSRAAPSCRVPPSMLEETIDDPRLPAARCLEIYLGVAIASQEAALQRQAIQRSVSCTRKPTPAARVGKCVAINPRLEGHSSARHRLGRRDNIKAVTIIRARARVVQCPLERVTGLCRCSASIGHPQPIAVVRRSVDIPHERAVRRSQV